MYFYFQIRAREAAKAAREMTRSAPESAELERLSRLPEMARIVRNFFVAEKKAALPWDTVSTKLASSYPSMLATRKNQFIVMHHCTEFIRFQA